MNKVRGIFCLNSKCKHYFEDNCMLIWETDTVHISSEGKCKDFEAGQHIGYADESALASATSQLNDIPFITEGYFETKSEQICEIPKDKGIKITCRIRQSAAIKQLDDFMEHQIIPLKEKYPHIEIDIEIG